MRIKLAMVLALTACSAQAEVMTATTNGFQLKQTLQIAAAPAAVYQALTQPERWWNPAHTWSGDAANLSLDARAGGCFCEKLPDGGSVQHLSVVYAAPGKMLRLSGALGPLQSGGLAGAMSFNLKSMPAEKDGEPSSTELVMVYAVGGYSSRGLNQWAPDVDGVLQGQLSRLKSWVETGKP